MNKSKCIKTDSFQLVTLLFSALYVLLAFSRLEDLIALSFVSYSLSKLLLLCFDIGSDLFAAATIFILGMCMKNGTGNSRWLMLAVYFSSIFKAVIFGIMYGTGVYPSTVWLTFATTVMLGGFIVPYLMIAARKEKLLSCDFKHLDKGMDEFHSVYRKETHELWNHIMDLKNRLYASKKNKISAQN